MPQMPASLWSLYFPDTGGFEVILRLEGTKLCSISKPGSKFQDHFRPKSHLVNQESWTKEIQDIKEYITEQAIDRKDILEGRYPTNADAFDIDAFSISVLV
jgi:hypothetical protein